MITHIKELQLYENICKLLINSKFNEIKLQDLLLIKEALQRLAILEDSPSSTNNVIELIELIKRKPILYCANVPAGFGDKKHCAKSIKKLDNLTYGYVKHCGCHIEINLSSEESHQLIIKEQF